MKKLLRLPEIDIEYGVKDKFVRCLVASYGLVAMGIGEALYDREDLENALRRHSADGRPPLKTMEEEAKQNKKKVMLDAVVDMN